MQKKPHILFILHLPPPTHGASMMGKYVRDSQQVNEAFECRYINLAIARNIDDVGAFRLHKISSFLKLIRLIRKEVKAFHPDLVYITPNTKGGAFYKEFVIIEMLKRMGCKVVAHLHNKGVSDWQDHWYNDRLYKAYFNNMKIILLAKALYADISKYADWKDIYLCPNGIPDVSRPAPTEVRKNAVPHILFLSNLIESKGILVLLDALSILKQRGHAFVCDVVGGESAEISSERLKDEESIRGIKDHVVYHGSKYDEEKNMFFCNADVFAFPTYYECFPLVLLEAMQQGVPCISTDEGGIPDIIEDGVTGFITPKQQALPLADRLEQLITDVTLRHRMGMAGRKKYEQAFTLFMFENRIVDILKQCVSPHNAKRYVNSKSKLYEN